MKVYRLGFVFLLYCKNKKQVIGLNYIRTAYIDPSKFEGTMSSFFSIVHPITVL